MAIQLTKERYESTPHGAMISWGVIENSPDGCFMTREGPDMLLWTAWKGGGNDWAIYVIPYDTHAADSPRFITHHCHMHGDKVTDARWIDRMVHADPEVNARYRR